VQSACLLYQSCSTAQVRRRGKQIKYFVLIVYLAEENEAIVQMTESPSALCPCYLVTVAASSAIFGVCSSMDSHI
jgi:hypothetical protein